MTEPILDRGDDTPSTHVVVATHSREIRTALFIALNAIPTITIVATATSTAELASYCHAFQPDIAIVEGRLPGRPLAGVLSELRSSTPERQILLIDVHADLKGALDFTGVEVFTDLDQLMSIFPNKGTDAP